MESEQAGHIRPADRLYSACRTAFMQRILAIAAFLLLVTLALSPRFLVCSDTVRKADIVILFPVPELEAVNREADQLIGDGIADHLCIPTSLSLYRADPGRNALVAVRIPRMKPGLDEVGRQSRTDISMPYFEQIKKAYGFPHYYENTHVEMLLAKQVMDAYGFRKAILVSSPAHMKRMKIIAKSVFDSQYDLRMVPSRFMTKYESPLPSLKNMQNVFMEFPKMAWFFCYDLWGRWSKTNRQPIVEQISLLLDDAADYNHVAIARNPDCDGKVSHRIIGVLRREGLI